jgi:hypothetical protein
MREVTVERYFRRQVILAGGEARKLVTPGRRHAADRLVLWPGARIDLVELKKPGKKPRPGQKRDHERLLRRYEIHVTVIDTHEDVDIYIEKRRFD